MRGYGSVQDLALFRHPGEEAPARFRICYRR